MGERMSDTRDTKALATAANADAAMGPLQWKHTSRQCGRPGCLHQAPGETARGATPAPAASNHTVTQVAPQVPVQVALQARRSAPANANQV